MPSSFTLPRHSTVSTKFLFLPNWHIQALLTNSILNRIFPFRLICLLESRLNCLFSGLLFFCVPRYSVFGTLLIFIYKKTTYLYLHHVCNCYKQIILKIFRRIMGGYMQAVMPLFVERQMYMPNNCSKLMLLSFEHNKHRQSIFLYDINSSICIINSHKDL